jgi:chaperonin cofactor prefoldin
MNHDSRSLEDELASLKAGVAVIRSNYVAKADLQEVRIELKNEVHGLRLEITELRVEIQEMRAEFYKALHDQTWKLYGFGAVLVAAVHFVTRAGY